MQPQPQTIVRPSPPPLPVSTRAQRDPLPLDHLNARRAVEVHVDRFTRQLSVYAEVHGALLPVSIPGGPFSLAYNEPRLILDLLKIITGRAFEPAVDGSEDAEVWVRTDYPSRFPTARQLRR